MKNKSIWVEKEQVIQTVKEVMNTQSDDVDIICDIFIEILLEYLSQGFSIDLGEHLPNITTKIRIAHRNQYSPKELKSDYILSTIKILLDTKGGKTISLK